MANTLANLIKDAELAIAAENASRNAIRTTPVNNTLRNLAVGGGALGAGTAGGYYGVGAMAQSDDAYAQSLLNARRNAIPSAFRGQEQGLEAPMFSPDDLIGTGLITKAALMAKGLIPLAGVGMVKAVGKKNALMDIVEGSTNGVTAMSVPKTPKNLNAELLQKYKDTGYLSFDEMAQYEKNALKMEGKGQYQQLAQNAKSNPDYADYVNNNQYDYMHGTERLDRVLEKSGLDPKRATSGPMPFGTDSPELASSYAVGKADTSRIINDDGNMADYFQVSPKSLGERGTIPYNVERTWYRLSPEKRKEITENYYRLGYSDPEQGIGDFVLHPAGSDKSIASRQHLDYTLNQESKGNALAALRNLWGESGAIYDTPDELANIYKIAGYPHEISQANAPWTSAKGVLTGKARIENPLVTSNVDELQTKVIPALREAFKGDRTRKTAFNADMWDKNARYTPKEWVDSLEQDLANEGNSYVWTSIPDKVTEQLSRLGYNGILDVSGKGGGLSNQVVIPFKPNQVRSKFAAFDPLRKDSSSLLAGGLGGAIGLNSLADILNQEQYQ